MATIMVFGSPIRRLPSSKVTKITPSDPKAGDALIRGTSFLTKLSYSVTVFASLQELYPASHRFGVMKLYLGTVPAARALLKELMFLARSFLLERRRSSRASRRSKGPDCA